MRVAGIMSGTSLDGVDVAVVDLTAQNGSFEVKTLATYTQPYPDDLRAALLAVSNHETHTREIARLHFLLPQIYAECFFECCRCAELDPASVELIGSHGQTVYHEGIPANVLGRKVASTLQIGDGSVLAELTRTPVVSDFRPRDIAAGGQGAPLVPYVDWLLFRDASSDEATTRVLLNIGGIANVTLLPPNCEPSQALAFDTGPGNMVIDQLAAHFSGGAKRYDAGGEMASAGAVDPDLLASLMKNEFYRRRPPKSAGREQFGAEFVESLLEQQRDLRLEPADLVATVTHLTAATIADAICACLPEDLEECEVIASGGGVRNPVLMSFLRAELPEEMDLTTTADYGIDPDFKEAIAFAVLAHETWQRKPSNLPSATGARHAVVLGKVSY
jgi:anhydro-N-acetylmuramic acid kinase